MAIRNAIRNTNPPPSLVAMRCAPCSHAGLRRALIGLAVLVIAVATHANADAPDDRADPRVVQILDIENYRIVGRSQGGVASAPVRSTLSIRILGTPRDGSRVSQARIHFTAPEDLRSPRYGRGLEWIEMTMPLETLPGVLAMIDHPYGFVRYREWSEDDREAEVSAGSKP